MQYRTKMWLLAGLAVVSASATGIVTGYIGQNFGSDANFWLVFALLLMLAGGLFAIVWLWLKPLDDLQKQAHMSSWYWGGMGGAVALIMWLVASRAQHSEFGMGAAVMFFVQFAGFVLYYAFWWLRGRVSTQ